MVENPSKTTEYMENSQPQVTILQEQCRCQTETPATCNQGDGNVVQQLLFLFQPALPLSFWWFFFSVSKPKGTEVNLLCGSIACKDQRVFITHWDISVYQKCGKTDFESRLLVQVDHILYSFSLPCVLRGYCYGSSLYVCEAFWGGILSTT